jgi:hypothetical protein
MPGNCNKSKITWLGLYFWFCTDCHGSLYNEHSPKELCNINNARGANLLLYATVSCLVLKAGMDLKIAVVTGDGCQHCGVLVECQWSLVGRSMEYGTRVLVGYSMIEI